MLCSLVFRVVFFFMGHRLGNLRERKRERVREREREHEGERGERVRVRVSSVSALGICSWPKLGEEHGSTGAGRRGAGGADLFTSSSVSCWLNTYACVSES